MTSSKIYAPIVLKIDAETKFGTYIRKRFPVAPRREGTRCECYVIEFFFATKMITLVTKW